MKEVHMYECEVCKEKYEYKTEAENCERSHAKMICISDKNYDGGCRHPLWISIEFEDGCRTYKLVGLNRVEE